MFKCVNRLQAFITQSRLMNFVPFSTTEITERHLAKDDALPPVDPNCLRIYRMRYCPYAHRTKLVLEHKKIPHETVLVNVKSKPDWLFERNPLGLVPILEHKGNVIYESAVCDEFLEEAFPGSTTGTRPLLPSCPYERAAVRLFLLKFDTIFPSAFRSVKEDDVSKRDEHLDTLKSKLEELEQHLVTSNKPFFGGSEYALTDLHLYPVFERLPAICMFGFDVYSSSKYPGLAAWTSAMQQMDCVRKLWISPKMHHYILKEAKGDYGPYDVEMDDETIAMQSSVE